MLTTHLAKPILIYHIGPQGAREYCWMHCCLRSSNLALFLRNYGVTLVDYNRPSHLNWASARQQRSFVRCNSEGLCQYDNEFTYIISFESSRTHYIRFEILLCFEHKYQFSILCSCWKKVDSCASVRTDIHLGGLLPCWLYFMLE